MPVNTVLSVKNMSFSYGAAEVLSGVSFDVQRGDYIGLAGPNGAGKTTLIKAVLGLTGRYAGAAELFGVDMRNFSAWHRVGYLPQRVNAFNPLFPATVKEVVGLGLLSKKSFPKSFTSVDDAEILRTLELMGIADLGGKLVGELSGGQQQRVFLARALAPNPELLILDEPSTALDPVSRQGFYDIIKKLNQEKGITCVLITHDTAQIGRYANKLLYLDKKVVFYGRFQDFCQSPEMTSYFGSFSQHLICHQH
jgi:zinc transport system ATP-binding protein